MFKVMSRACETCIYKKDSRLDLKKLESEVRDNYGGFRGHRICHHSRSACCRGFWNRHKNKFAAGQIAQRLKCVSFVKYALAIVLACSSLHAQDCNTELYFCLRDKRTVTASLTQYIIGFQQLQAILDQSVKEINRLRAAYRRAIIASRSCRNRRRSRG